MTIHITWGVILMVVGGFGVAAVTLWFLYWMIAIYLYIKGMRGK